MERVGGSAPGDTLRLRQRPAEVELRAARPTDRIPMRLNPQHVAAIKQLAAEQFGADVRVRLFGSRVDDAARGGDVDLLVELDAPVAEPGLASARFSVRVSRAMNGRKVDVLLAAPNLRTQPIHEVARREGVLL